MKQQKWVLLAGIFLPLAVVLIFAIAINIPKLFVAPPQYKLLLSSNLGYNNGTIKFQVLNQKLIVSYNCVGYCERPQWFQPSFIIFNPRTNEARTIPIPIPNGVAKQIIVIPELSHLTLSSDLQAPDGFTYREKNRAGYNGFFFDVFGSFDNRPVITHSGYTVPVKIGSRYVNYNFVGWIIKED